MEPNFDERHYLKAKKRVKELKVFYDHLKAYIITIPILVLVNIFLTKGGYWVQYTALGWGIGLATHALMTFDLPFWDHKWEERKISEILEKDKEKNKYHGNRI